MRIGPLECSTWVFGAYRRIWIRLFGYGPCISIRRKLTASRDKEQTNG